MAPQSSRLADLLRSACSERPDRSSVNELVALACGLAKAYLRVRHRGPDRDPGTGSADDLALDLVGELFCRDAQGRFTALQTAFADLPDDPDAVFTRFRRVVFGRVAEGIFDHRRANDPEFARIVRGLKAAAHRSSVRVEVVQGSKWLVFRDDPAGLPTIAPEILESLLTGRIREGMTIEEVLSVVGHVLGGQDGYRRALPVVLAARVIRSTWNRFHRQSITGVVHVDPESWTGDGIDSLRTVAVARVRSALRPSYVRSGKIDAGLLDAYLSVVDRHMAAQTGDTEVEASLFERFRQLSPGLDRREYNARHRARLEYVWRCVREAMARNVRVELGISANPSDCKE